MTVFSDGPAPPSMLDFVGPTLTNNNLFEYLCSFDHPDAASGEFRVSLLFDGDVTDELPVVTQSGRMKSLSVLESEFSSSLLSKRTVLLIK